jgi:MarR family 2-MHQ and catechol resistance regulon transcriptional repressor
MPTRYQGTESERTALDVFIKLSRASDAVCARIVGHLGGTGVSLSQFGILDALYHVGPMCLGELARKHLKSPNNITSVVDTMERSGLVERQRQAHDRRLIRVQLTDKGRETFERYWPNHRDAIVDAVTPLTAEEQRSLCELLKKLGMGNGAGASSS